MVKRINQNAPSISAAMVEGGLNNEKFVSTGLGTFFDATESSPSIITPKLVNDTPGKPVKPVFTVSNETIGSGACFLDIQLAKSKKRKAKALLTPKFVHEENDESLIASEESVPLNETGAMPTADADAMRPHQILDFLTPKEVKKKD